MAEKPPTIVFKGKGKTGEDKELKRRKDIQVVHSDNGWMNDSLTEEWVNFIYSDTSFFNRLLIWDSHRCHISEATKKALKRKRVSTCVIPGGCTSILQAPDVYWNKPFKQQLRALYDDWLEKGEKTWTKAGNFRAPSKTQLIDMVLKAWNALSSDLIVKSFMVCGQHKFAKPEDVTCLKDKGPVSEAKQTVVDIWESHPDAIGQVENAEIEEEEQLFANELIVIEKEDNSGTESEFANELVVDPLKNRLKTMLILNKTDLVI